MTLRLSCLYEDLGTVKIQIILGVYIVVVSSSVDRRRHCAIAPHLGHGTMQKSVKHVKISVLRFKWSTHMKTAFANCHFNIIFLSV